MQLSDDKQHATVEVKGTFQAAELEALIGQLTSLRAAMAPQVPSTPPMTHKCEDAAASRARGDPCVQVAVMRDGMTRFWVRHAGLGWFGFNLPVERANLLANCILDMTSSTRQRVQDLQKVRRRHSDVSH
ncbi:MAG TPA: hypothetical protein VFK48_07000 [Usitatibacter sp.]|nr:hypothetical protein [Usitatibacter sp.]